MAILNATTYVADITVDTPLLTPIIHITLFIDNVFFQNPQLVFLSLVRNDLVQNTFKIDVRESVTEPEDFVNFEDIFFGATNPTDPDITPVIVIERDIVYFAEPPPDIQLPITFDFDISAVVVSRSGSGVPGPGFTELQSLGIVTVDIPPGKAIAATTTNYYCKLGIISTSILLLSKNNH